jgi:hypothetical protein
MESWSKVNKIFILHISNLNPLRRYEKLKSIIWHIILYLLLIASFVLGLMNTTWIYLYAQKSNKEIDFIGDFIKMVLIEYLIYEVIILITKSLIFFTIIRTKQITCWKKCLIAFINTLPWVS